MNPTFEICNSRRWAWRSVTAIGVASQVTRHHSACGFPDRVRPWRFGATCATGRVNVEVERVGLNERHAVAEPRLQLALGDGQHTGGAVDGDDVAAWKVGAVGRSPLDRQSYRWYE